MPLPEHFEYSLRCTVCKNCIVIENKKKYFCSIHNFYLTYELGTFSICDDYMDWEDTLDYPDEV